MDEALPPPGCRPSRIGQWSVVVAVVAATYVLGSGPILAGCCWLRELTGRDEFYAVFWLYAPLLVLPFRPLGRYIEWWFWLFGTVGPG